MYMYVCAYMHTWASIEGFCVEQYGSIRRATGPWCTRNKSYVVPNLLGLHWIVADIVKLLLFYVQAKLKA